MSNREEKSSNGIGSDPLQRLASFKAPRDLSLGGVKPNKKVFVPNLNVTRTRNKNNRPSFANNRDKDDSDGKNRKNNRNKTKNGPRIIKSSGVFSEGLGSVERNYSRSSLYSREADSKPSLQKPTIRVKDVIKIDKELEEQMIKSVMGESGTGVEESEDFKRIFDTDAPVKLPMDDGNWMNNQAKSKVKIKQEIVVKEEPSDETDIPMPDVEEKPLPSDFEDTNVLNLLKSDKPTLILLQLPDSLPGRGGPSSSRDEEPARRKHNSNEPPAQDTPTEPVDNRCRLSDLEEGRIGKLQVRRSGRVTLTLGDTVFEVCPGTKAAFHQEAVSVAVDHSSRSASLVALGPLQHKLNAVPHWQSLFNHMAL